MNIGSLASVSMADREIQENAIVRSPFYIDSLFAAEFVGVEKLPTFDAMFVNEFGHFYVEAAIFSDLHQALFAPPFDRVDPVGGLAQAERRLGDVPQF